MHEVKAIIRRERLQDVLDALHQIRGIPGITASTVAGIGIRQPPREAGVVDYGEVAMTKLEIVVPDTMLADVVARVRRAAFTGHPGDGKVFVLAVEQAMKIRSDEEGTDAL